MIAYEKWKQKELSVPNLLLDPLNPRIPEPDPSLSQRQLITELVQHDKVYELARNIADNGYFPVEALIIIEKSGDRYVVEGNRRLAALKLLLSPELAPSESQHRFEVLSERASSGLIKKLRVMVAPSRRSAAHIIMAKHTAPQVESWKPIMRAKFYKGLVGAGLSVDDISEQYGVIASEVTDALRMHTMYQIACALDLPEEVAKKVRNPREFPMTTVDRLYVTPKVSQFLGIRFDENKQPVGKVAPEEFKKGYSRIVSDIALGKKDSRHLNTTEDIEEYLKLFGADAPDLGKKGRFTAASLLKGAGKSRVRLLKRQTSDKTKTTRRKSKALIPRTLKCNLDSQRINDIFDELRKLDVQKFPNAVAILLRTLLEMSVEHYLDKSGKMKPLLDKQRTKHSRPKGWSPTLKQMLQYILSEGTKIELNPLAHKSVKKLISDKGSMFSVDSLDFFVHNKFYCPTEEKLRGFWIQLEELFKITLVEPSAQ